jgi:hypothetical protein
VRAKAETLREAARLMRERAEAATPGPWHSDTIQPRDCVVWGPGEKWLTNVADGSCRDPRHVVAFDQDAANSDHIGGMHPLVALAVADWLDAEAEHAGACPSYVELEDLYPHAFAVARIYLGESPE